MLQIIASLLSGIGVFVFSLTLLNFSLEKMNINLPKSLEKRFNNPFVSTSAGVVCSMLMQSSSAVNSVMVQLSDKSVIREKSAYYVILGSNIGTTVTAYIAVLSNLSFSAVFTSLIFFSSISLMLFRNKKARYLSLWVSIFALIFVGLTIISNAIPELVNHLDFRLFTNPNPLYLLLVSTIFTAICQSSSLVAVIVVTLTGLKIIPVESAMFMIMGANIGTCSTSLLVSVGKSKRGINVALFNLFLNAIGVAIHVFAYYTHMLDWFININVALDTKIALYHTFFNITSSLIVLPFIQELDILFNRPRIRKKHKHALT